MLVRLSTRLAAATCYLVAMASLGFAPAARAADAPLRVIRHMTFDVTYDSESTIETKVSGMGNGGDGAGAASGMASNAGPSTNRKGVVTVDVVAVTADGGLAVDISQDRGGPSVRVGITAGSALLYDESKPLTEEERALLRFLARGFVKDGTIETGSSWTDKSPDPKVTDQTTYAVTSIDEAAHTVVLNINGERSVAGLHAYRTTTVGTMVYDMQKVVPLVFELTTRTEVESNGRLDTVVGHTNSKLLDDSRPKP